MQTVSGGGLLTPFAAESLVEAGERGKNCSFTFAQRYVPADFETIGNPVYLGQTAQRLQE